MFRFWKRPPRTLSKTRADEPREAVEPTHEEPPDVAAEPEPLTISSAPPAESSSAKIRATGRRYSRAERAALLDCYHAGNPDDEAFCAEHGIRPSTLSVWLREERRTQPPRRVGFGRRFTPEERRAAVEAYMKSGRTRNEFVRLWGCSSASLDNWRARYRAEGPKGLEDRPRGYGSRPPRPDRLSDATRDEIVRVRALHAATREPGLFRVPFPLAPGMHGNGTGNTLDLRDAIDLE